MRNLVLNLIVIFYLLAGSKVYAQNSATVISPSLLIRDEPRQLKEILLEEMLINVKVVGNLATTSFEMRFFNPNNQVLEGELVFPLMEGATVTGFAMDVNGKLREGVPVEKNKGQQVFETIERRQVDPGLMELVAGNTYKTRIYPIPATGYKTVIVTYNEELQTGEKGRIFNLPLYLKKKVKAFSLDVEILKQRLSPVMLENSFTNLKFNSLQEVFKASANYTDIELNHQLKFAVPVLENESGVYVSKGVKTDESYFYVVTNVKEMARPKKMPKQIAVFWDVSSSVENRKLSLEIELLKAYLKEMNAGTAGLYFFSNTVEKAGDFNINRGNSSKLIEKIEAVPYDGGTQLGAIDFSVAKADEVLVFTDGMNTFGQSDIRKSPVPLLLINSSAKSDHSFLNYLAISSGGEYINLQNIDKETALKKMKAEPLRFLGAEYGDEIAEVYPSVPVSVSNSFSCAGKLKGSQGIITLRFGFGKEVVKTLALRIKENNSGDNGIVEKAWAGKKLWELDLLYEKNRREIRELGKDFSLVTRNTSLIVLETLDDYLEFEIEPPADMLKEYYKILHTKKEEEKKKEESTLDKVAELYQEKIDWWSREVKPEEKKKRKETWGVDESGEGSESEAHFSFATEEDMEMGVSEEALFEVSDRRNKDDGKSKPAKGAIYLKPWNPDAPYLKELSGMDVDKLYSGYLRLKKENKDIPSFYTDVSNLMFNKGLKKEAVKVISNLAEIQLLNHELMRVLAHKLEEMEEYKLAIEIYEKILEIRKEEPQSYRDLALVLAKDGQYQVAVDMLYGAIKKNWDGRFPGIEVIMVTEMNAIIEKAGNKVNTRPIDERLLKNLPVNIRIVLNWDADNTDMDLWVTDPKNEKCYYEHKETQIGGLLSNDFTRGYGPEEFLLKKAITGKYKVQANYYGSSQQRVAGPVTVYLQLFTNYGEPEEELKEVTVRLSKNKEVVEIGELNF